MEDKRSLNKEEMDSVSGGGAWDESDSGFIDLGPSGKSGSRLKCMLCGSTEVEARMNYEDGTVKIFCKHCGSDKLA